MINPIRLKGKPAKIARYYTVGDYYTKGADEHSEWGGKVAAELGLEGKVDPGIFKELLAGKVGDQQLGRRRKDGNIQHHPGWDFAVNAPKSVSIMALVAGDERIIEAHEQAVGVALTYLEEHATMRHRVDGEVTEKTTGRLHRACLSRARSPSPYARSRHEHHRRAGWSEEGQPGNASDVRRADGGRSGVSQ